MNTAILLVGLCLSFLPGTLPYPTVHLQPVQIQQLTRGFPAPVFLSRQLGEIHDQVKALQVSA